MADSPAKVADLEKSLHEIQALLDLPTVEGRTTAARLQEKIPDNIVWQDPVWNGNREEKPRTRGRLAYLDGLRGFAALLVYCLHYEGFGHTPRQQAYMESGFGFGREYCFAAFPIIRIFFSGGHFAVAVFFIISGYVLASGPLRSIHSKNAAKVADSISSALFRRWFRLFIPVGVTTFVWMASWHIMGWKTVHVHEKNLADEAWKWYCEFKNMGFIFNGEFYSSYNFHTWSIPLEFRGSIVVYTTLLALRRVGHGKRLCCEATLAWYFLYIVDGWYCALFVLGILLCDIDHVCEGGEMPKVVTFSRSTQRLIYPLLMLAGLYLGGVPTVADNMEMLKYHPGWYWLSYLKPQAVFDGRWFFRVVAATLVMISVPRIAMLKSFFETRFCQFLGRVSYGFYLIHGPVLWTLGDRLYAASGRITDHHINTCPGWINYLPLPDWGPLGLEINQLAPQLILLPFTLWLADVVTRLVDEPSVKFAQWLMRHVVDEDEPRKKMSNEQLV